MQINSSYVLLWLVFQDFNEDESESDEDNSECTSESEAEDENDACNEEDYTSSGEARTDGSDDEVDINASAEALRKLIPYNVEEFEKVTFFLGEVSNSYFSWPIRRMKKGISKNIVMFHSELKSL